MKKNKNNSLKKYSIQWILLLIIVVISSSVIYATFGSWDTGFRINKDTDLPISYNNDGIVTNTVALNVGDKDMFLPTKTKEEYDSFCQNGPDGGCHVDTIDLTATPAEALNTPYKFNCYSSGNFYTNCSDANTCVWGNSTAEIDFPTTGYYVMEAYIEREDSQLDESFKLYKYNPDNPGSNNGAAGDILIGTNLDKNYNCGNEKCQKWEFINMDNPVHFTAGKHKIRLQHTHGDKYEDYCDKQADRDTYGGSAHLSKLKLYLVHPGPLGSFNTTN